MPKLLPLSNLFPNQPASTFALNIIVNKNPAWKRNLDAAAMRELGKLFKYGSDPNPSVIPPNVDAMEYWLLNAAWRDQEAARELADFYFANRNQGKLNCELLWRELANFSIDAGYVYKLRTCIKDLTGSPPVDIYEA